MDKAQKGGQDSLLLPLKAPLLGPDLHVPITTHLPCPALSPPHLPLRPYTDLPEAAGIFGTPLYHTTVWTCPLAASRNGHSLGGVTFVTAGQCTMPAEHEFPWHSAQLGLSLKIS